MKNVLVRLQQYRSTASNAECGVLDYMMSHPEESSGLNIRQLAELSYSSTSTILRLCRKLGFEGFKDLQKSLLFELAQQDEHEFAPEMISVSGALSIPALVETVTARNIRSLSDSSKLVEEQTIVSAVDLLYRAENLILLGLGASQLVAQDAHQKFMRVGKNCKCSEDIHSQYVFARNASPRDIALIISYSGCTEEMIHCARVLHEQGTPIISITRFDPSPISQLSDCCLNIVGMSELYQPGVPSSRIAMLNMIDILYNAYVNRNVEENLQMIERTQLPKAGRSDR